MTGSVDAAFDRLAGVVTRTPLELSTRLSERTGDRVWLKREDLQVVRSYKLRGAYHLISRLAPEVAARGVVCASAGNHAQGVALASARLRTPARIYVPRTTPRQKRDRIRALGRELVELVVEGDSYDESAALAAADATASGRVVVPAFDHPDVVAGQGTVVREIWDELERLGRRPGLVVVPVGGGGLLAGCLSWLAEHHPDTPVLAVEPAGAASLTAALGEGGPVALDRIDSFVDGACVRQVGAHPFALIAAYPGPLRVLSVDNGLVCEEMIDLFQTEGVIAEPAGALAPAALRLTSPGTGTDVVAVISGGNQDISRYAEVAERALVSAGLKHYFLVEFPQEPGALRRFLDDVLGPEDDITLFEYVKRTNREYGPALVGIELGTPGDLDRLLASLAASPIRAEQIDPDNPVFRYLV
ncbi:threonine dehydratase [Friedmanniella endophytica]|uniref:L-threonine dehydratase n=1 Tax=Microlunatus kandeliicorticis TaxID=1759536 RepID=A0A7W3P5G7_9ACTN|nr:threonine ammonia-lyase IlvA [Microlunatus kandeliicorticis]MBA8793845.1 threonine dehydratase [Microlunatus kandeliicorticis]